MTREEIGRLLTILRATYHNVKLDNLPATVDAWHLALVDAPFAVMQEAARAWIGTSQWFPTPAELRMLAIEQAGMLPSGGDAWAMVLRHMRNSSIHGPAFDGPAPVAQAVAAIGGWRQIRCSEEPGRDRTAFLKAYETYRLRAARDVDMRNLVALDGPAMPALT
jgi:hypothetical protein